MVDTVVLHVGAMKSGTSFLQQQLLAHRSSLASSGVTVLGESWGAQVRAVRDALQPRVGPAWERLLLQSRREQTPRAILSMEFLGPASTDRAHRVVDSLRPARVEAVLTVRDLNRSILSLWQETVQNGRWWTFAEYVQGVAAMRPDAQTDATSEAGRTFWRQQGLVRICRRWAAAADQLSIVTVPPPGAPREELLSRFVQAAGLPDLKPMRSAGAGNQALGGASILAMRQMNELLAHRHFDVAAGLPVLKGVLAKRILASRRADEPALGLAVPAWVPPTAAHITARLQQLDLPVFGEWSDLDPVEVPGMDPAEVPASEVAEAATFAMAGLVQFQVEQRLR